MNGQLLWYNLLPYKIHYEYLMSLTRMGIVEKL